VTGKYVPYRFLVKLHDGYAAMRNRAKGFLINRLPKLYVALRNIKNYKRAKTKVES